MRRSSAVRTLHSPYRFDFDLANGVREYPGYGVSARGYAANGPTGGWMAWWSGRRARRPSRRCRPTASRGSMAAGAIQYFYRTRPQRRPAQDYDPNAMKRGCCEVSALMDSTNPT